jgi:hypothetical protein
MKAADDCMTSGFQCAGCGEWMMRKKRDDFPEISAGEPE